MQAGAKIDEDGVMLRDGDVISLRRDPGGRFLLHLRRIDVNAIGARVRIVGTLIGDDLIDVDEVHLL